MGGVNVFGGGLALYAPNSGHPVVGGIGVSGDSSCADALIAFKVRQKLGFDYPPNCDQIDVTEGNHAACTDTFQASINDTNANYDISRHSVSCVDA